VDRFFVVAENAYPDEATALREFARLFREFTESGGSSNVVNESLDAG
jgi:hypothetical protein